MRLRARLLCAVVLIALPLSAGFAWWRERLEKQETVRGVAEFMLARMEAGGREQCEAAPAIWQDPPRYLHAMISMRSAQEHGGWREQIGQVDKLEVFEQPLPAEPSTPTDELGRIERIEVHEDVPKFRFEIEPIEKGELRQTRMRTFGSRPRFELFAYDKAFASANADAPAFPADLRIELADGSDIASEETHGTEERALWVAQRMPWNDGPCAIVLARRFKPEATRSRWIDDLWMSAVFGLALGLALVIAAGPIVRRVRNLTVAVRRSAESGYTARVVERGRDEIGELARAFDSAGLEVREQIERVQSRERALREFVENTMHDVMLPLTVLQGHLVKLAERRDDARDAGDGPQRELVRESLEETHYIGSLVHNLSAAAKLEAVELPLVLRPFALNELVGRAVLRHQTIAKERGVELDFAVPERALQAQGDVTLVEQAVSNLIHNAVRYNRAGGHVAVLLEERDEQFVLRVFDDGPGVPPEERARLGERSYRSEEARRRHPTGMGLGLSIAREVCTRHGFEFALTESSAGGLEVAIRGPKL